MNLELIRLEIQLKTAMSLMRASQILKILLAVVLGITYFYYHEWLTEVLVASVILVLVLPLGFFDGYITTLLEYHNSLVRESQEERAEIIQKFNQEVTHKIESLEEDVIQLNLEASNDYK